MKISPLQDFVHIRKPKAESMTGGGIILPAEKADSRFQGTVLSVGPDVKTIKTNDIIIYKQFSSTKIPGNEGEYLVREEDVLAKL